MPQFTPNQTPNRAVGKAVARRDRPAEINEPRCHVCQSKNRRMIDKLIARGTNYSELERIFDINRQAIGRHADRHLNYENAAIQQIIREEAIAAEENIEEGVKGITMRKVYLNTALHKAMEALLEGDVIPEPRDAVAIIERLEKFDEKTQEVALEEIRLQFFAYLQAMKEIVSDDIWDQIKQRTKELISAQSPDAKQLIPGDKEDATQT